jgi:hypothetical protein
MSALKSNTMSAGLPPHFAELTPLLAEWALPTETLRSERRWRATPAEFRAFYDAVVPRLADILAYLGEVAAATAPAEAEQLLYLSLAFAEAAPHVELYRGNPNVPFSFDPRRFVAAHGDAVG